MSGKRFEFVVLHDIYLCGTDGPPDYTKGDVIWLDLEEIRDRREISRLLRRGTLRQLLAMDDAFKEDTK